ncbi:hypothetical protein OUZ56_004406 [Daphnia magna]|uniref:Uncharacterized protein n=1 Tax=Daphnia magna TaxID=35525 RepID=A0ABQ9YPT5_9CRUS|nr:hypothetical protein OUZ56_004406 [Daphnia magna]
MLLYQSVFTVRDEAQDIKKRMLPSFLLDGNLNSESNNGPKDGMLYSSYQQNAGLQKVVICV